jgi:glutamine amidotransferase
MCRFVAYFGSKPLLLSALIERPSHSLINQGKTPRLCKGMSGDGFGVSWYDPTFEAGEPCVYKTILPAWNDPNVKSLIHKIQSSCFLGHVRAATTGEISFANCHPFVNGKYAFVHNGSVSKIEIFRRRWLDELDQDLFEAIKGQTDSELLFYLILQEIRKGRTLVEAFSVVIRKVQDAGSELPEAVYSFLNMAMTDGTQLVVVRYATNGGNPPSLFYSKSSEIVGGTDSLIVASEGLTESESEWTSLNNGEILTIDGSFEFHISTIEGASLIV